MQFKDISILHMFFDAEGVLEKVCENDANGSPIYIGYARPGTGYNEPFWYITKQTYDANSGLETQKVAGNAPAFAYAWDDRATYF